ncbi:unnamed protein product [Ceratitis capitata]|uniref:(Mediterranean fruit fly) hypothetical protein n=1 Tax=Ceratitis capitata TaxID=7213 RepID=A0A811U6R5_CERCA|nr:unnamed protein product [Ceratitis capitata]
MNENCLKICKLTEVKRIPQIICILRKQKKIMNILYIYIKINNLKINSASVILIRKTKNELQKKKQFKKTHSKQININKYKPYNNASYQLCKSIENKNSNQN